MIKIASPEHLLDKIKNHFDKTDAHIILTTFIVGFITNFKFFISSGVAGDAIDTLPTHFSGTWEISLGRFLIQFFDHARFGLVDKVLIVSASLLFIALAIIFIRKALKIKSKLILILLTIIISIAPQFTETYEFIYCADAYTFAFLLSAIAFYFSTKIINKKDFIKNTVLLIITTALLCSIYQAYLGVLLGLVATYAFKLNINDSLKNTLKYFVKALISIFLGVCIYYISYRIILKLTGAHPAGYKGANGVGLELVTSLPIGIKNAFSDFYLFFFGEGDITYNHYYGRHIIYAIMATVFIISTSVAVFTKKEHCITKTFVTATLLLLMPVFVNITDVIALNSRIYLVAGTGLLSAFVLFAAVVDGLKDNSLNNILRYISYLTMSILGLTYSLAGIYTYTIRDTQTKYFDNTIHNIYMEATSLKEYSKGMKFIFSNTIKTPASSVKMTTGFTVTSDVSWPGFTNIARYKSIYKRDLGIDVEFADASTYEKVINTDEFRSLNTYADGHDYTKVIDGVVVVKISNQTLLGEDGHINQW